MYSQYPSWCNWDDWGLRLKSIIIHCILLFYNSFFKIEKEIIFQRQFDEIELMELIGVPLLFRGSLEKLAS